MANLEMLSGQVLRDADGDAYLGAKASYWSDSGATTPLATYSDAGLTTPNTQPVVSDGTTGAFGAIYLSARRYWRTVTTSADVSLPQFNLGPIDANMTLVTSAAAPSPTYPLLYWYDTTTGNLKRRNAADSAWIDLGGIDSLLNAATVTEQLAGTSAAKSSTPDSVAGLWQRGTSITPSAGTVSLPATGGGVFDIQAGNFAAISSAQGGRPLLFEYAGASVITHNGTSMDLIGDTNRTTAAGGRGLYVNLAAQDASGANWREFFYQPADGSFGGVVATQLQLEAATNNTFPVTAGRMQYHPGVVKAWGNLDGTGAVSLLASHNVTGITDLGTGSYNFTITTAFSSANWGPGLAAFASGTSQNTCGGGDALLTTTVIEVATHSYNSGIANDMDMVTFVGCGDQ